MKKKMLFILMKAIILVLNALTIGSIIFIVFLYGVTFDYQRLKDYSNMNVSCDGIEYYYTNTTFVKDAYNFLEKTNYTENDNIIRPIDFFNGERGDCKSISHSIMCLSKLYNVTCVYYVTSKFDPTISDNATSIFDIYTGHIGINCHLFGKWIKFY